MVSGGQGSIFHRQKGNAYALTGQMLCRFVIFQYQDDIRGDPGFCKNSIRYVADALLWMKKDQWFIFNRRTSKTGNG